MTFYAIVTGYKNYGLREFFCYVRIYKLYLFVLASVHIKDPKKELQGIIIWKVFPI